MQQHLFADSISFFQAADRLNDYYGEKLRIAVDSILLAVDLSSDLKLKADISKRVFGITQSRDEIAHIRSLTYMAKYAETPDLSYFDEAFRLAKKHQLIKEMDYVEDRRSRYFISKKQYDSAMIHILRMKDLWPEENTSETYQNILHLLGDLYFNSGMYSEAEKVYSGLLTIYEEERPWNYWRPYVIINNLGLVALKFNDFNQALRLFKKSEEIATSELHTNDRNNILAYIKAKIAEILLAKNNPNEARKYLHQVSLFPENTIFEDARLETEFMKSKLLLAEGSPKEALIIARRLVPVNPHNLHQYKFIPEVYKLMADIYSNMFQTDSSLAFLYTYSHITDSIAREGTQARSMIILAEKAHEKTSQNLTIYQQRFQFSMILIFILIIVMVVILTLYRKLYQSKRLLFEKLMEKNKYAENNKLKTENGYEADKTIEKEKQLIR